MAVPSPLSTKDTPDGSGPVSLKPGFGDPVATTVNESAVPALKVALVPEVNAGIVAITFVATS